MASGTIGNTSFAGRDATLTATDPDTYSNSRQSLGIGKTKAIPQVWTLNDSNVAAQGLGGTKQTTFSETVTLSGVNDAPILTDTLALMEEQTGQLLIPWYPIQVRCC